MSICYMNCSITLGIYEGSTWTKVIESEDSEIYEELNMMSTIPKKQLFYAIKDIVCDAMDELDRKLYNSSIVNEDIINEDLFVAITMIIPSFMYPIIFVYSNEFDNVYYGFSDGDGRYKIDDILMENDYGKFTKLDIWNCDECDIKSIIDKKYNAELRRINKLLKGGE